MIANTVLPRSAIKERFNSRVVESQIESRDVVCITAACKIVTLIVRWNVNHRWDWQYSHGKGASLIRHTASCFISYLVINRFRINAIGKELIEEQCLGEFLGVAKLSKEFNHLFSESLISLIDAGGKSDYFEAGMHTLLNKTDVYYCDVSDLPCLEIDFLDDLNEARGLYER